MQSKLICVPEGDELLFKAVLVITNVVWYFVVDFQTVVVFVVAIPLLLCTDTAGHVLEVDVNSELVFVEEVFWTELAVRVQEGDIAELIDISLLKMTTQGFVCVQFLLFQDAGLLFDADFTK